MRRTYHVAIVGGGFSGTALATHLLRCGGSGLRVSLIEAGDRIAGGSAYATEDDAHLLNTATGGPVFMAHTSRRVLGVSRCDLDGFRLSLSGGEALHADAVVLAIGHPRPADPLAEWIDARSKRYIRDPWQEQAYQKIAPDDRVLIIGTGLTAVDALLTLTRRGHRRPIHAISRRGLLARAHDGAAEPLPDDLRKRLLADARKGGLRQIVRALRACIASAAERGIGWHAAFDALRAEVPELWASLDASDRRRFVDKVRPFWDVHRHRLAPEPASVIEGLLETGRLSVRAGRVIDAAVQGEVIRVDQHLRGEERPRSEAYSWVINCAGPELGRSRRSLLERRLLRDGLLRADPIGLGYLSAPTGAALGARGLVQGLYLLGPVCRPRALEHTAIADLAEQAEALAVTLAAAASRTLWAARPLRRRA